MNLYQLAFKALRGTICFVAIGETAADAVARVRAEAYPPTSQGAREMQFAELISDQLLTSGLKRIL